MPVTSTLTPNATDDLFPHRARFLHAPDPPRWSNDRFGLANSRRVRWLRKTCSGVRVYATVKVESSRAVARHNERPQATFDREPSPKRQHRPRAENRKPEWCESQCVRLAAAQTVLLEQRAVLAILRSLGGA